VNATPAPQPEPRTGPAAGPAAGPPAASPAAPAAPAGDSPDGILPYSPAAERNKAVVLAELQRLLGPVARVLELASGTGQHARHGAQARPQWQWWPSEPEAPRREAIDARCRGLANVHAAFALDVMRPPDWAEALAIAGGPFDAVYVANLLHIAPWPVCAALMRGAADVLTPAGHLVIYGPFRVTGVPTAPSNEAFDADLRARDPHWGLRELDAVRAEAATAGLALHEAVEMPANNRLLVFARGTARGLGG
jgi:SAM-dependent methyltransferase